MADKTNAGVNAPESNAVGKKAAAIVTNLESEIIPVSIHSIKKLTKDGHSYLALSCTNLVSRKGMSLTVSTTMADAFGLTNVLAEGNYNSEANPPLYLNVEAVYIPNDGQKYGYVTRDADGNNVVREYRNTGCYVFRNLKEPLNGKLIRDAESSAAAAGFHARGYVEEAKMLFEITKGRVYVASISLEDDAYFRECYRDVKSGR